MTGSVDLLETMVGAALAKEASATPYRIRELISKLIASGVCGEIGERDAEMLARRFEERLDVTMTLGSVLTDTQEYEPWLDGARASVDPYYWDRYRRLLIEQGFSKRVIAAIDSVTDRILGLLENPEKDGRWDRRGMVVGHVQSGKTANYTGVICKAADAGYRVIVIIAGIHNNLRNQTQIRIDEGFVGRDSARLLSQRDDKFIGVGNYDQRRRPVTFTNSVRDFNKVMATSVGIPLQNLNEPAVFVIKKNANTLKNLLEWLKEHSAQRGTSKVAAPLLLIDDEADNASINIRHSQDEVSRINGQIRSLLNMFERSCYLGYTATPFANIFIDPESDDAMCGEDLFPRNFIISLDPPSNYFGPTRMLLDHPEKTIRHIEDNEDLLPVKHTKETQIVAIPPSMKEALRTFVVARAIRLARGHTSQHCSMLINASRFTGVQSQLRNVIHDFLEGIKSSVRINGALPTGRALQDPEIAALQGVWCEEYLDSGFGWPEIQKRLNKAVAPISVVEINSRSSDQLNYRDHSKDGLNVIAVGGYSLSRGLTLEGLMVSYFLRNSIMYDTLMQMGRWFGYRPEYEDLCRVWMTEEAEGWYTHIAESIEMLRDDLRNMSAAGATPEEFGLKVRSHPDTLIVTARNKLGSGEQVIWKVGLGNNFVETAILKRDPESLAANRQAAVRFSESLRRMGHALETAKEVSGGFLLSGVAIEPVKQFIGEFKNHEGSLLTAGDPIRRYITDRGDELANWDVLFTSIGKGETIEDDSMGRIIRCQRRTAGRRSTAKTLYITNKQRVASRGIEKTGLSSAEITAAEREYRERKISRGKLSEKINYPDRIYRRVRKRPLLIVHLLKIVGNENDQINQSQPVVAWSISFPESKQKEKRVEYVVNTTWIREHFGESRDEEEMWDDDA